MTRHAFAGFAALLSASLALAAEKPTTIPLWPGAVPGEKADLGPETSVETKPGQLPVKRITNVTKPTITVYHPDPGKNTGTAVVVAPGGGYSILAWEHEGTQVADWLRDLGVTAVLLKYRVPRRPDAPKDSPPVWALQDAQRAVSLTRAHAAEWGVDPHRVGFLGFSAGGHLTAWVSNADKRAYDTVDDADKQPSKPDFAVLIYPGGLLERNSKDQFRPEIHVSKQTPPSFLAVASDDKGSLASTLRYYEALNNAGVRAELHVYATGGHGFGMRQVDKPHATWTKRCEDWMRSEGFLTAKK